MNKPDRQLQTPKYLQKTSKQKGDVAEDRALHHLETHVLKMEQRNYRTPGRGGGEIDLITQDGGRWCLWRSESVATYSMTVHWPA